MPGKPVKPVPCRCGDNVGIVHAFSNGHHYVECMMADCWRGPVCKGEVAAVKAWNSVMKPRARPMKVSPLMPPGVQPAVQPVAKTLIGWEPGRPAPINTLADLERALGRKL